MIFKKSCLIPLALLLINPVLSNKLEEYYKNKGTFGNELNTVQPATVEPNQDSKVILSNQDNKAPVTEDKSPKKPENPPTNAPVNPPKPTSDKVTPNTPAKPEQDKKQNIDRIELPKNIDTDKAAKNPENPDAIPKLENPPKDDAPNDPQIRNEIQEPDSEEIQQPSIEEIQQPDIKEIQQPDVEIQQPDFEEISEQEMLQQMLEQMQQLNQQIPDNELFGNPNINDIPPISLPNQNPEVNTFQTPLSEPQYQPQINFDNGQASSMQYIPPQFFPMRQGFDFNQIQFPDSIPIVPGQQRMQGPEPWTNRNQQMGGLQFNPFPISRQQAPVRIPSPQYNRNDFQSFYYV